MTRGTVPLLEQHYTAIQAHILDPDNSPLPEKLRPMMNRVLTAAKLLDSYPVEGHIIRLMQAKYSVTATTVRKDIQLAKTLFKTNHTFDWDFWQAWQLKDQMELIHEAKLRGDLKAWNNAKKVLHKIIGDKPEAVEDPRRMERNVFNIQVNYNGQTMVIDFDKLRSLDPKLRAEVLQCLYEPVNDAQAEEIMES